MTTVVITRPSGPYGGHARFLEKIRAAGFEPFQLPVLRCVTNPLTAETREQLSTFLQSTLGGWLAFLSPTAIWAFRELMEEEPLLGAVGDRSLLAVQGVGTADACREIFGRAPDFIPSVFVAEEFAREFKQVLRLGQYILVPQSAEGRDLLATTLARSGHLATSFSLYRLEHVTPTPEVLRSYLALQDSKTCLVFMSPSAVKAVVELVGPTLHSKRLVSVGPLTSQAIRKAGLTVWREATEHSEEGVLRALADL